MGNTPLKYLLPFILVKFHFFSQCGTMFPFFAGEVAMWGTLDEIRSIKAR